MLINVALDNFQKLQILKIKQDILNIFKVNTEPNYFAVFLTTSSSTCAFNYALLTTDRA